jgi:hypothetical protein
VNHDDEDDDFDYVYHLPHADLSRLGARRDPFASESEHRLGSKKSMADARYVSTSGLSVTSRMSGRSISKKQVRAMLGGGDPNAGFNSLVASKMNSSRISLNVGGDMGFGDPNVSASSRRGSVVSIIAQNARMGRRGSFMPAGDGHGGLPGLGPGGFQPGDGHRRPSMLGALTAGGPAPGARRASTFNPGTFGKVAPMIGIEGDTSVNLLAADNDSEELETGWRALPDWWTNKISSRTTALISLIILTGLTLYVFIYDVMFPPQ